MKINGFILLWRIAIVMTDVEGKSVECDLNTVQPPNISAYCLSSI